MMQGHYVAFIPHLYEQPRLSKAEFIASGETRKASNRASAAIDVPVERLELPAPPRHGRDVWDGKQLWVGHPLHTTAVDGR